MSQQNTKPAAETLTAHEQRRENRLAAILGLAPGHCKVLWGKVVERSGQMNFKVHGTHDRYVGPEQCVDALMPEGEQVALF